MKLKQMIVDADICIKMGSSEKFLFIEKLFPCIAEKIYIHTIVFDEIKVPACAKLQLEHLIELGIVEVINESNLSDVEQVLYHAIYNNLADVMVDKRKPNKNKGEVSSLAMAKVMNIPIFATDEKDLQPIINEKLNTGINDIFCMRIIDIISKIKNSELNGFTRKDAKILWVLSGKLKNLFDTEIWPI